MTDQANPSAIPALEPPAQGHAGKLAIRDAILRGDVAEGEVELKPYETKTVTLVPRAGSYGAHCSHFFHKQMGMSDRIIVF